MRCLRWMSNVAILIGLVLMYGAAGGMDYAVETGSMDMGAAWLLIVGMIITGIGMYGKRKDF